MPLKMYAPLLKDAFGVDVAKPRCACRWKVWRCVVASRLEALVLRVEVVGEERRARVATLAAVAMVAISSLWLVLVDECRSQK